MAMASLQPSQEKANFFRLTSLLVDGGTKALRHQFDQHIPPVSLQQCLREPNTYGILQTLIQKRKINRAQKDLLFPATPVCSASFDISLLILLLSNICGLHEPIDGWGSQPDASDLSVEADIERLRRHRNEIQHAAETNISNMRFETKWQELKKVLLRLGNNIPGFEDEIDSLRNACIDPEKENIYRSSIRHWEQMDKQLSDGIEELKEKVDSSQQSFAKLREELQSTVVQQNKIEKTTVDMKDDIADLKAQDGHQEEEQGRLATQVEHVKRQLNSNTARIQGVEEKVEKQSEVESMGPELRCLCSRTDIFLEDYQSKRHTFVETTAYNNALRRLHDRGFIILSGSPGEGKTTIAANLLLANWECERCLVVRKPEDWNCIDWKVEAFDAVLIDDMFGSGTTNKVWLHQWLTELDILQKIVAKKKVKFIITTRQYILEESKPDIEKYDLFTEEANTETVSTGDLTSEEKENILIAHLKHHNRDADQSLILDCVLVQSRVLESIFNLKTTEILGFPECVSLFARQDELFSEGASFFQAPEVFFKRLIQSLSKDESQFLALLLVWASPNGFITRSELEDSPKKIRGIASRFGFKLKARLTRQVKKTLDFHSGGLLTYSEHDGSYSFSHNIIQDMVGIVASADNPKATIAYASTHFFMEYITTDISMKSKRFYIETRLFPELAKKVLGLLLDSTSPNSGNVYMMLKGQEIHAHLKINFMILLHDAFKVQAFVKELLTHVSKQSSAVVEEVLGSDVVTIGKKLQPYGLDTADLKLNIIGVSLFLGCETSVLLRKFLEMKSVLGTMVDRFLSTYMQPAFIFAVVSNNIQSVEILLKAGASVVSNALYIAAVNNCMDTLNQLLRHSSCDQNKAGLGVNGNNALMVASKLGNVDVVRCLLENGANPDLKNDGGKTALDKAILYEKQDVCEVLILAGANITYKTGKLQRTPLHIAADKGLASAVKCMIETGANIRKRDKRGHCAIHCAAMQGRAEVVRIFLQHDVSQKSLRASTYGRKSVVKGMTAFHYAARKGHSDVAEVLLEFGSDPDAPNAFGQTPAYIAASYGHLNILRQLEGRGDLNKAEKQGFTPLHTAVYRNNKEVVEFLCNCPFVDVNRRDNAGKTPLHVAYERDAFSFVKMLKNPPNPADQNIISRKGLLPMHRMTLRMHLFHLFEDTEYDTSEIVF